MIALQIPDNTLQGNYRQAQDDSRIKEFIFEQRGEKVFAFPRAFKPKQNREQYKNIVRSNQQYESHDQRTEEQNFVWSIYKI